MSDEKNMKISDDALDSVAGGLASPNVISQQIQDPSASDEVVIRPAVMPSSPEIVGGDKVRKTLV